MLTSSWPLWPFVATSDKGGGVARWSVMALPTWNFLKRSANSATETYLCGSSVLDQYCCTAEHKREGEGTLRSFHASIQGG